MTIPRLLRSAAVGLSVFLTAHAMVAPDDEPVKLFRAKPHEADPDARAIVVEGDLRVVPYFVPDAHTPLDPLLYRIKAAEKSIRVQAYGFTSAPIADALIDAKRRGVDVRLILDRSNATDRHSRADACLKAGIIVLIDKTHLGIAHNKVVVVDGMETMTGSYNLTASAQERNAENAVFIHSPGVAKQYLANWDAHSVHAVPYGIDP